MKKFILGLEKEWMAIVFGIMGILLIIFPVQFTQAIPWMLGLGLIANGIVMIIALVKYRQEANVKAGRIVIVIVLGFAILFHRAEAIAPIGAIWAMVSLYEVGEEITESFETRRFSVFRIIAAAFSTFLAILLMFNPFDHFTVHVQILGLEMLVFVFVRKRRLIQRKKEAEEGQKKGGAA